ncbi:hypothetical protein, partial [Neisseria sicca]|uniref:hypothetical protein n=1 Tax=Neisseria sicca TaxID=490 RepID=UPI003C70B93E
MAWVLTTNPRQPKRSSENDRSVGFAHEKHQQKGRLKPKIRFQTTSETNPKRRLPPATATIKNRPKSHPKFSDDHKTKARTLQNQGPDYKEEKTNPSVRTPFRPPSRIQAYSDPP